MDDHRKTLPAWAVKDLDRLREGRDHWASEATRLIRELAIAQIERDRARDVAVSLMQELDQADVYSVIVGHGPRG